MDQRRRWKGYLPKSLDVGIEQMGGARKIDEKRLDTQAFSKTNRYM